MLSGFKVGLAAVACAAVCLPAIATIDMDGVALEDSVQVAGKNLKLNGAGVSVRMIFKVYAMGLYLQDRRETVQEVFGVGGPRRLVIAMLRDVSGEDFKDELMQYANAEGAELRASILGNMLHLGKAVYSHPQGLRKGDTLTLDWVPGTGTVVELNQKRLLAPLGDMGFYNALLNIWLGEKPADSALKLKLLGRSPMVRTSASY